MDGIGPVEADALRAIAAAAYEEHVPRIGRAPAPMTAGYARAVRDRQAWVAIEDGQIAGFAILIARHGYAETHRAEQDGFRRVFFRKPVG